MRQHRANADKNAFSILTLDDDPIMTSTLQAYFQRSGYRVDVENDPLRAIERVRDGKYDILLLDFLMTPICGDQVVERIREFNKDIFIILLTGHKTMAPPIKTIRALDIQGYYEKSDRFDQLELLVESCVKAIRQMTTIRDYQQGLASIVESLPDIYDLQTTDNSVSHIMDCVLHTITKILPMASSFLLLDTERCHLAHLQGSVSRYCSRSTGNQISVPTGEQIEQTLRELGKNSQNISGKQVTVSLMNNEQVPVGFLRVELDTVPAYQQVQLLGVVAKQVSAALSNMCLHSIVQEKNEELDSAYSRLGANYSEIIAIVRKMVDAKDFYTRNHSDRVSFYSVELAKSMGKDETYCERLKVAGLFHDIGKISIPDGILLKESKLTDEEFDVIKTHPARGAELLSSITYFHDITPWVRAHHERYDGKGYPDHLAGTDIPEQARIIAVADAFDAMTSDRRYRKGLGLEEALKELVRGKGTQFDPDMVDKFIKLAESENIMERAARAQQPTNDLIDELAHGG